MKYIVSVAGRDIEIEVDGERVTVNRGSVRTAILRPIPGTPMRQLMLDGQPTVLAAVPRSGGRQDGGFWGFGASGEDPGVVDERTRHIRNASPRSDRPLGPVVLRAPMPRLVVRVATKAGGKVAAGAGLVVLEAMKMENENKSPAEGVVDAVRVESGPGGGEGTGARGISIARGPAQSSQLPLTLPRRLALSCESVSV